MTAGTTGRRAGRGLARWFVTLGALIGLGVGLWRVIRYSILDAGQATGSTPLFATVLLGVLTLLLLGMSARRTRDDLASYRRAHEAAGAVATAALKPGALTGFAIRGLAKGSADVIDLLAPALATVMGAATVGWAVEVEGWPPVAPLAVAVALAAGCGAALAARVGAFSGRRIRPQDVEVAALPAGIVGAALLGGGAYQLAVTYGRVEAPTVAFAILTGLVAGVLGSSASYAAKAERRKAAVRGQVAAALGVADSALAEDAPTRWKVNRRGEVHLRPGGGAGVAKAAGDLAELDAKLAQVAPELMVDRERSGPGVGLVLVPVTGEVRAERALLAETDGVVVGVEKLGDGTEKWTLAATVSPTQAERVDALARRRGLTLVEWRPFDREAVVGQLSEAALTLRAKLAELIRTDPWGLALEATTDEAGAVTTVRVDRSPAMPDPNKRRLTWLQAINAALPVQDDALGWRYRVDPDGVGLTLTLTRDPLRVKLNIDEFTERFRDPRPDPSKAWMRFPVAIDEDGNPVDFTLFHTLGVGQTGAGKGSVVWSILSGLLPSAREGLVRFYGIDPKAAEAFAETDGRKVPHALFERVATTPEEWTEVIDEVAALMKARQKRSGRSFKIARDNPLVVLFIDEMSALTMLDTDPKRKARVQQVLLEILSQGRSDGVLVVAAVQAPQKEMIGQSRMFFAMRVALRTEKALETDLVLGDGATDEGAAAHEIPVAGPGNGYATAGIAYMRVEGQGGFQRVRFPYTPDEQLAAWHSEFSALDRGDDAWRLLDEVRAVRAEGPVEGELIATLPAEEVVELGDLELDIDLDDDEGGRGDAGAGQASPGEEPGATPGSGAAEEDLATSWGF